MAQDNKVTYSVFDAPPFEQKYRIYDGGPSRAEKYAVDMVKSLPGAIPRAAAGLVGLPQTVMDLASRGITKVINVAGDVLDVDAMRNLQAPTSEMPNIGDKVTEGYDRMSQAVTGSPVYRPQTGPGRVADMTAQTLVGGPGALGVKAAAGVSSGVAGEVGRAYGIENPIALGVIQMLGGMAPGLAFALRSVPADNINRALQGVTDQQLTAAQKLMDDARRMGTPLTGAEALAQVTGRNLLQDIQRVVEQSSKGAPIMQGVMNNRPVANTQAFTNAADRIGGMPAQTDTTAGRVQTAAEAEVRRVNKFRTDATSPYYKQQRDQDLAAVRAAEALPAEQARLAEIEASRGSAVNEGGKLTGDANTLRIQSENPQLVVPGYPRVPGRILNYPDRAAEATAAAGDFKTVAARRAAEAQAQQGRVAAAEATANIPLTQQVQDRVRLILSDINDQIATVGIKSTEGKILAKLRDELAPNGEPVKYASQLESIHKTNKALMDVQPLNATPEAITAKGVIGKYMAPLDEAIKDVSPTLREGKALFGELSQRVVNPVEEGLTGSLTAVKNEAGKNVNNQFRNVQEILMPQNPVAVSPPALRDTVARLNRTDPTAARDFVRQSLQGIFDEATQNLQSGANQWGGAKFATRIAGNTQQRDNLQALVEASAGRQAWVGFNRFLEVLEAQGKRQAPGSQTAQNQILQADMAAGGAGAPVAAALSPNKALSIIGNAYDSFRYGKNTAEMARILTDEKSVELMKQLAKEAPMSARAALLTNQILAGQQPSAVAAPNSTNR